MSTETTGSRLSQFVAQIPFFSLSSRARIPKHPESSAARSWERGEVSVGMFFWLFYSGRVRTAFALGAPCLPVRRGATGTAFALGFLLWAETRTPGDVLTSRLAHAPV